MNDRLQVSPDALLQEVGADAVILDLKSGHYFGLDEVGLKVWRGIRDGVPLAQVKHQLLEEYDVPPQTLHADVEALVQELLQQGLVTRVRGDTAR